MRLSRALWCSAVPLSLLGCEPTPGHAPQASPASGSLALTSECPPLDGDALFHHETFGGNGRTCATCHVESAGLQLDPAEVRTRPADDPLFQTDAADSDGTSGFDQVMARGTIHVQVPMHPAVQVLHSDLTFGSVLSTRRAVPTALNVVHAENPVMWDGRAPDLFAQARGAIEGHAGVPLDPANQETECKIAAIVEYERAQFSGESLRTFAIDPSLPPPLPEPDPAHPDYALQKAGMRFFEDRADPDDPKVGSCALCHAGPMLNQTSQHFDPERTAPGTPPGSRFFTALVSEMNPKGDPVQTFVVTGADGLPRTFESPDIGQMALTGDPLDANFFRIPTIWGVNQTAPYFHDNSASTLEELIDHYERFFVAGTLVETIDTIAPDGSIVVECQVKLKLSSGLEKIVKVSCDTLPLRNRNIILTAEDKKALVAYLRLLD